MSGRAIRSPRALVVATVTTIVLAGCGSGGSIDEQTQENQANADGNSECGQLNLAVGPWIGSEADAYVLGHVAEQTLGCRVSYKELKEDVSWQGLGTGDVDVIIEDWGHPDLEQKYFADSGDGSAQDLGSTGNVGIIGWYVPPWLAKAHPDILDYKNLNKYAEKFKTSESRGRGQLLGADPSYVQFDEAIVSNLDLDFTVIFSGSEAASIQAFRKAEQNKEWLIGYFWEPMWVFADVPLERVSLPPYEEGCQDTPATVDCDYPETTLKKIAATSWIDEGSSAVDLVKSFTWTNDDQNQVGKYIAKEGMTPEEAAVRWVEDNAAKVESWLD